MHLTALLKFPMLRKPRTMTGRVAQHLRAAVLGVIRGREREFFNSSRSSNTLETIMMVVCDHLSRQQMLDPVDFDNANGEAALYAIVLAMWPMPELQTLHVTPAWRRVVISARRLQERIGMHRTLSWRGDNGWQIA